MSLDAPFSGNVLAQASGTLSWDGAEGGNQGVFCNAYLDSHQMGFLAGSDVSGSAALQSLAITGASSISAGAHTVAFKCDSIFAGTTPNVTLNAFAVVTGN
jgi:hypothetical protein